MGCDPSVQVVGAGSPILDLLVRVSDPFLQSIAAEKGGMRLVSPAELDEILNRSGHVPQRTPGGSTANTIFGLAKLGNRTALIGKMGRDEEGDYYRRQYMAMGGDPGCFKTHDTLPTGRCLSLVTPDSERTMRTDLGAAATLAPPDLETTDFVPGCLVHIEGYLLFNPGLVGRIIEMAKASRCTISLDLSSFEVVRFARNELAEHLRQTDIVFANESEAAEYCDGAAPSDALEQLSRICPVAVVKIGKAGALVRRAGEPEIAIPTRAVQAVDTTGAGDLWQAGFLHGYLRNLPLEACGRIGNLLGGEVVQVLGAAIPEERWTEIRRAVATLVSR